MFIHRDKQTITVEIIKELLQSQGALIAVFRELAKTCKNEDLKALMAESTTLHVKHRDILQQILKQLGCEHVQFESKPPASMSVLIKSRTTNPRIPYGIINALETHMDSRLCKFKDFEIVELYEMADEQRNLTEQVREAIQRLTAVLPHGAISR